MLVLSHALSGGALGQRIGNPFWAFLIGIIFHFILDKVPHFWPETKKSKSIVMALDGFVTFAFIFYFIYQGVNNLNGFLAGAIGGIIVDVLMIYTPLYNKKIGKWHTKRQLHKTSYWYFLTDIIAIILSLVVIGWFK